MKKKTFIFNPARVFPFLRLFFMLSIVVSLGFMGYTVSPGWSSSGSSSSSNSDSNFNWSEKDISGKTLPQDWQSIAMSSDGNKIGAVTWTQKDLWIGTK